MKLNEIAILSGKGGTGKTSLSAALATLGDETIVADCDVDAANLHIILSPSNYKTEKFITGYNAAIDYSLCTNCGVCIRNCSFNAISLINGVTTINSIFCDGCELCTRICPHSAITMKVNDKSKWHAAFFRNGRLIHARLEPGEENSGKLVAQVRNTAKETANTTGIKTIIIDGPPGIGCPVISSFNGVGQVVIVTEPSTSAFHDLTRLVEVIKDFHGKKSLVINKYDINKSITNEIEKYCSLNAIEIIGKLPFDKDLISAIALKQSIVEFKPDSAISKEIRTIWEHLKS